MSISQLKVLKKDKRYNRPLAFNPTGKDIKILLDAIEESQASSLLDPIKYSKGYNSSIGMTLSGIEVKAIVDSIACPPDSLWVIRNKLRYNTRHEYILTGKDVKILIDAIEDTSCLVAPDVLYYAIINDGTGNPFPDISINNGEAIAETNEDLSGFMSSAFATGGAWWNTAGGEFFIWCISNQGTPTTTMVSIGSQNPIAINWIELNPVPTKTCYSFTGNVSATSAYYFYQIYVLGHAVNIRMDNTANNTIDDTANCEINLQTLMTYAFGPDVVVTLVDIDGSRFSGTVTGMPFALNEFIVTDGVTPSSATVTPEVC